MSSGAIVTFNDPRRFGCMKLVPRERARRTSRCCASLGPEPLGNEFDAALLADACSEQEDQLKAALSDQRVVAGLGNIYVCEALSRSRMSPKRMASTLRDELGRAARARRRLVDSIKAVLNDAIKAGGSSLRDHRQTTGELGLFQHRFRVYDREGKPCPTRGCNGMIRRIVQTGRSTFFCPVCQK